MNSDDKLNRISQILDDYADIIWKDLEIQENLLYLIGRYLQTGQDITDSEIDLLDDFLKKKIDKYVKEKAN